jgi:hypothetical protein
MMWSGIRHIIKESMWPTRNKFEDTSSVEKPGTTARPPRLTYRLRAPNDEKTRVHARCSKQQPSEGKSEPGRKKQER